MTSKSSTPCGQRSPCEGLARSNQRPARNWTADAVGRDSAFDIKCGVQPKNATLAMIGEAGRGTSRCCSADR